MTTQEERIITLEEELAHLRLQNEELSSEMLKHWNRTELLEKRLVRLEEGLQTLQDRPDSTDPVEKPPHW